MTITGTNASLATYICSGLALAILLLRLFVSQVYRVKVKSVDWLSVAGIVVVVARLVNDQYLLADGTANDALTRHLDKLSQARLHQIKIGSILALVARLFDTTFYWLQTAVLLVFYSKLLHSIRWATTVIKVCWGLLVATYVAVVVVTFTECRPFHLYWQIYPNPGSCAHAYVQLFLQGAFNIALDLTILVISVPLLQVQGRSIRQKSRIAIMITLGLFCVIITCVRIPLVVQGDSAQPSRTFFASIQILTSAFVANMPTIYGKVKNIRRKMAEQSLRRGSAPEMWWGSRTTTRTSNASGAGHILTDQNLEQKTSNDSGIAHIHDCVEDIEIV